MNHSEEQMSTSIKMWNLFWYLGDAVDVIKRVYVKCRLYDVFK